MLEQWITVKKQDTGSPAHPPHRAFPLHLVMRNAPVAGRRSNMFSVLSEFILQYMWCKKCNNCVRTLPNNVNVSPTFLLLSHTCCIKHTVVHV